MSRKVIVNGESICYLPPVDASEIRYDTNNTVKDVLDELDIDNIIQPKQRHYSITSDTEIIDWDPGIHMITISASQDYLPSNWGTLIKFNTEGAYGCVIFINTYNEIWRRHFHAVDKTWYTEWMCISRTNKYTKYSAGSGNTFEYQLKLNRWYKFDFCYSQYNVLITSAFGYYAIKHIGGAEFDYSLNTTTGVITFTGKSSNPGDLRNGTPILIEEVLLS
jgi:hypothetical protein